MNKFYLKTLLLCLFSLVGMTKAFAHDIAVANADGATIYYKKNGNSLIVTFFDSKNSGVYADNKDAYSGDLVIPESVTYNGVTYSVTSIDNLAFALCSGLTSVTIPNTVTSIGYSFLSGSGVTSITIPSSVQYWHSMGAFGSCNLLESVTLYCKEIPSILFRDMTSLKEVVFGEGVTSIGNAAFSGCTNLTSVTFSNSVTSIGERTFSECGLKSITIPQGITSVTSIGSNVFQKCDIESVTYHSSCIGSWFNGMSSIKEIVIGEEVTSIGNGAFSNFKGLTSVTIPDNVTSMGDRTFKGCTSLTSVNIPNSVTSIGENVLRLVFRGF